MRTPKTAVKQETYERTPLTITRFKISVTENRVTKLLRDLADAENLITELKEREQQLLREGH